MHAFKGKKEKYNVSILLYLELCILSKFYFYESVHKVFGGKANCVDLDSNEQSDLSLNTVCIAPDNRG